MRPAVVVVGDECVAEGLQLGHGLRLPRLGFQPFLQRLVEPFHLPAGGRVVRFGVLLGHAEIAQFSGEAVEVSRPARPPAKRVVNTMPLSDSTEAGMPWSATVCRNTATTTGPVTVGGR